MADKLLTYQEAADYLRMTKQSLWDLLRNGELKFIMLSQKRRRIKESDLIEYVNGCTSKMVKKEGKK